MAPFYPHPAVRLAQRLRQAASLGFSDAQEEVQKILSEAIFGGMMIAILYVLYVFYIHILQTNIISLSLSCRIVGI